jgi:hypothetical protein
VDEDRLDGAALILRAIDLTIADVQAGDDDDRDERLRILESMRERWRENVEQPG